MWSLIHELKAKVLDPLVGKIDERFPLEKQEAFLRQAVPLTAGMLREYFRLKVDGMDNIPKIGPAIIVSNHSGLTALDAVLLAFEIHQRVGRLPKLIAHRLWFSQSRIAYFAGKMGLVEATKENTADRLRNGDLVILFPEGEAGNFKPSSKAYHLREFKRGFVRLALDLHVPVIPVAIVGAEEANINLRESVVMKSLFGLRMPVPLNIIPLPSKWHIRVLPPLKWSVDPTFNLPSDDSRIRVLAHRARKNIMHEIRNMLEERGHPYI